MAASKSTLNNNNNNPKVEFTSLDDKDAVTCGIGSCRPAFAQRLANPKVYLFFFCMLGILQGAYFTYTVGIVSTIEKRYAFDSKVSGLILIADNISPIFFSVIMGYYGSKVNRPRMVGFGMLVLVLSCFLSSLPYYIYGPGLHLLSKKVENGTRYEVCELEEATSSLGLTPKCNKEHLSGTTPAVALLFLGSFLSGIGGIAFFTAGVSYLDDNVRKKDSPMFFSITMALRLFGPSFGFLLSSYSLAKFESPLSKPNISPRDPRWVGAWWLGFIILAVLLFIFAMPMFFFPRTLKRTTASTGEDEEEDETKETQNKSKLPSLKDLPSALMRLLRNPVFVAHVISVIFHCNGMLGYYILMPRYMEAHFRQTASRANLVSGATSIITMLAGIVIGGFVIRRFKPRPRLLTGYMVFVHFTGLLSIFIVMFLSCKPLKMAATLVNNKLTLTNDCNKQCGCSTRIFQPLCDAENMLNYFSPCHAGCTGSATFTSNTSDSRMFFTGCNCTDNLEEVVDLPSGFCPFNCNMFLVYIVVLCFAKLVSSTGRVGNTLIALRCIDPKDKTLSLGVTSCVLCIFAFIPYPLIYGALADSTCLVWEETCGRKGNCWHYDIDQLRFVMHGVTCGFMFLGIVFDFVVFLYSKRLPDLYDDEIKEVKLSINSDSQVVNKEQDEDDDILFMRRPAAKGISFNNINSGI